MPPSFIIIEQLRRLEEEERRRRDEACRPRLELPVGVPPTRGPPESERNPERGVVILDLA